MARHAGSPLARPGSDSQVCHRARFRRRRGSMKLITAVVKPEVTDDLVLAVTAAGARGLTATGAIGFARQYGHHSPVGSPVLLPKVRVDIVVRTRRVTRLSAPSQSARIPAP